MHGLLKCCCGEVFLKAFHMYLVKHIMSIIHCCSYGTPFLLTNHHRHQDIGTSLYQPLDLNEIKENLKINLMALTVPVYTKVNLVQIYHIYQLHCHTVMVYQFDSVAQTRPRVIVDVGSSTKCIAHSAGERQVRISSSSQKLIHRLMHKNQKQNCVKSESKQRSWLSMNSVIHLPFFHQNYLSKMCFSCTVSYKIDHHPNVLFLRSN